MAIRLFGVLLLCLVLGCTGYSTGEGTSGDSAADQSAGATGPSDTCPYCQTANPVGQKYCVDCGRRVQKTVTLNTARQPTQQRASGAPSVMTINRAGAAVDMKRHVVKGGVTVFDFYADWCGPCKAMDPHLKRMASSTPNVYLRKIDIKNWGSPVAKQYNIRSIPSVWVYDRSGKLTAERVNGMSNVQNAVNNALK